jgi:hypothetical protein
MAVKTETRFSGISGREKGGLYSLTPTYVLYRVWSNFRITAFPQYSWLDSFGKHSNSATLLLPRLYERCNIAETQRFSETELMNLSARHC